MINEVPKSEILSRVLAISPNGKSCGSALAYPINGKFYFITAAHVLEGMAHGVSNSILLFKENQWIKLEVVPFYVDGHPYNEGDIDLVIIKTPIPVTANEPQIHLSSGGMIIGQDAYFLGFPYFGVAINHRPEEINSGFPLPFIKKATISAMHNPIIYYKENKHKILGIISSYLNHFGEIKRIETSMKDFYKENSGIAIAYNIKYIIDLIKAWLLT
jgi:hypothetical protein